MKVTLHGNQVPFAERHRKQILKLLIDPNFCAYSHPGELALDLAISYLKECLKEDSHVS